MDIAALKARLSDVPGIETLTETAIGGRLVYGFNGLVAAVDPSSSEDQVVSAIRQASALRPAPMPPVQPQPKATPAMSSVTGARSASMSLKQMMDQAKQSVAEGMAEVQAGIEKHAKAGTALKNLGTTLNSDGDDLLATVGQFTNDLG